MNIFNSLYEVHKNPWGSKPIAEIVQNVVTFKPGTILDIGVGDGRNVLFLAEHGFRLVGLDIADKAIEILELKAQELGIADKVEGIVADISNYKLSETYDNIISNFTLHFIPKERFSAVLAMMKAHTAPGGVHYISDFTQDGPLYKSTSSKYWLKENELKTLYSDWEILLYKENPTKTRATDEEGNPYAQMAATLIARKPI